MTRVLELPTAADTDALGRVLARVLPPTCVMHLRGELGAGKSSLARALLRALGVDGPIKSPTYSLVERYALDGREAVHLDLYRIRDVGELEFLGLDDAARPGVLWLIEWPEKAEGGALPAPDLEVRLEPAGAGRRAWLAPKSPAAAVFWPALAEVNLNENGASGDSA
jgi:tRNA threonylcarbamoyl adenosine modification protein YjeE